MSLDLLLGSGPVLDTLSRPLVNLALQMPSWRYTKRSIDRIQQILEEVEGELVSLLSLFICTAVLTRRQHKFGETIQHDRNIWDNQQVGRNLASFDVSTHSITSSIKPSQCEEEEEEDKPAAVSFRNAVFDQNLQFARNADQYKQVQRIVQVWC
jgi:hypothetical protein